MWKRRVLYALGLGGAYLFHVFYEGYLSWYALVLVACLPLFSAAVSLPGVLGSALSLHCPARVRQGEQAECTLTGTSRLGLPAAGWVELSWRDLLSGQSGRFRRRMSLGSEPWSVRERVERPHCGCVCFEIKQVRVYDLLGLFSFPRPVPAGGRVVVLPRSRGEEPAGEPEQLPGRRRQLAVRPGGGSGEEYELRPYRPGDSLRAVHWKLSSKLDELVVRETVEERDAAVLLTLDHFGPPEVLDEVLGRLEAVSRGLLKRQQGHYVQWLEPLSGQLRQLRVEDEESLGRCLAAACSDPGPREGASVLERPLRVEGEQAGLCHLHLADRGEEEK